MENLNCPKCPSTLSRRTLVGVEIDQCGGCHGIFLDRGELEELLQAEHRHSRGQDPHNPYTGRRRADGEDAAPDPMATQPLTVAEKDRDQLNDFLDEIFAD